MRGDLEFSQRLGVAREHDPRLFALGAVESRQAYREQVPRIASKFEVFYSWFGMFETSRGSKREGIKAPEGNRLPA